MSSSIENTRKGTPKTIATLNFKGGVGKTTMTWCLGDYITTHRKENVLLFDLDAQMSLTDAIAENENRLTANGFTKWQTGSMLKNKTIYHAFYEYIEGKFDFDIDDDFIYEIDENYHFVPCSEMFYILDYILPSELKNSNRNVAQGFIRALVEKIISSENVKGYDYILLDCPPSFSLLSESALSCCDLVLIPFNPDFYATHGITILLHILQTLKEKVSFTIPPKMALFMNKAKAIKGNLTKESQGYLNQAKGICSRMGKKMNIRCFDSPIYDRVDIKNAVMATGKRGIPPVFVPLYQQLWDNITGFINE